MMPPSPTWIHSDKVRANSAGWRLRYGEANLERGPYAGTIRLDQDAVRQAMQLVQDHEPPNERAAGRAVQPPGEVSDMAAMPNYVARGRAVRVVAEGQAAPPSSSPGGAPPYSLKRPQPEPAIPEIAAEKARRLRHRQSPLRRRGWRIRRAHATEPGSGLPEAGPSRPATREVPEQSSSLSMNSWCSAPSSDAVRRTPRFSSARVAIARPCRS